jgi:NitT/TauT family transport system ATP-binding protein
VGHFVDRPGRVWTDAPPPGDRKDETPGRPPVGGALCAVGLSKTFRSEGREIAAVRDLTLDVAPGEFVCLLGPSGCGKSTFLNIAAGFIPPTAGTLLLDGRPVIRPGPDRGVVFQEHALFPWLSVADNIGFGLRMRGTGRTERAAVVRRYTDLVGLTGFEHSFPKDLSGGMRQRVAIARALANDPKMLLMDEPFGALDAQMRRLLQDELTKIWQDTRKTVLFVTHSIEEAVRLSDRVVVMTARPGTVREVVPIAAARPRDAANSELLEARHEIDRMLAEEIRRTLDLLGRNL